MAQGEVQHELFHAVVFGVGCVLRNLIELGLGVADETVLKLHLSGIRSKVKGTCRAGELFEFHDVARQRSSLVRENVFDLADLFVDVSRLSFHCEVLVSVVHPEVVPHETALPELNNFKCDDQGNRHKVPTRMSMAVTNKQSK